MNWLAWAFATFWIAGAAFQYGYLAAAVRILKLSKDQKLGQSANELENAPIFGAFMSLIFWPLLLWTLLRNDQDNTQSRSNR